MVIGEVDTAGNRVLVYGHSSANKQAGDSNKMWISTERVAFAAFTSIYNYRLEYVLGKKIVVSKQDADTQAALSGAVFELLRNGSVIGAQTTGTDGKAVFSNLGIVHK